MKSFEVRRTIAAPPETVWARLSLRVTSEASPGRAFALRVSEFKPHRRMVWEGGMPLGLFKGTRTFSLTASGGGTDFRMREEFTGLLAPLIGKSIPDLQPSFEQFADGLRRLAEGGAS
jgi:hypothetical protein